MKTYDGVPCASGGVEAHDEEELFGSVSSLFVVELERDFLVAGVTDFDVALLVVDSSRHGLCVYERVSKRRKGEIAVEE